MKLVLLSIFVVSCMYIFIASFLIFLASKKKPKEQAEYLLVLGARVYKEGISLSLKERLDTALSYTREHLYVKVIVSGGKGDNEPVAEALAMKQYLLENGVQDDRIFVEDRSTSTYENLLFSQEKFHLQHVIIVTNDYHLYRSKWIANWIGLNADGLAARTPTKIIMASYLREYAAIIHTWVTRK